MMANGVNGRSILIPWLIGLLFPALVGAAAGLVSNLRQYEGRIIALEAQHQAVGQRLESIERKLDRLIERQAAGR